MYQMNILLSTVTAFLVALTLIPIIIKVFQSIDLLDVPDKRKIHSVSTPSLGGIAIFIGVFFALFLSFSFVELSTHKYFLGATALIFLLGVKDDLSSLMAKHKLVVQIFSAILIVYLGSLKIGGLHGIFGIQNFSWGLNEIFTIFVIVVMTNSFNLIDGIDGLAGCISLVISIFFVWYFLQIGDHLTAGIASAISGGVLAFLRYNWFPSKVFMGDTGSMMLGFMISALAVKFLQIPTEVNLALGFESVVAIVIALLILPIYDTLRVFIIRFYKGNHPLSPDRNHIHHVMLKLGLNHSQATVVLVSYNLIMIAAVLIFQNFGDVILISCMAVLTVSAGAVLDAWVQRELTAKIAEIQFPKKHMKLS